jgi:cbb3-type cytochrome oxidase cytochrome c subunit
LAKVELDEEVKIMRQACIYAILLTIFFIYPTLLRSEDTAAKQAGRKIFVESRCYTCHTIKAEAAQIEKEKEAFAKAKGVELKDGDEEEGDDEKKGGDLSDAGNERDSQWLAKFVTKPKEYFKAEANCKKIAKKKNRKRFKGSDEELQTLVSYLSSLKYGKQAEDAESCLKED